MLKLIIAILALDRLLDYLEGLEISTLAAAVAALSEQVAATEGTEASAVALINGFATQVTTAVEAALTADNAADDASIVAAKDAIASVTARFNASAAVLGSAVANNQ